MNFPSYSLVKIDKGTREINQKEFDEKVEFHRDFYKNLKEER